MKSVRSLILAAAGAVMLTVLPGTLAQPPAAPPAEKPKETQPVPASKPESKPATPATPDTAPPKAVEPAKAAPPAPTAPATTPTTTSEEKLVYVKMTTSKGDMILELNNEKAPISTKNFLAYVDEKFYDGTIFHRVIDGFMVQGGGFTPDMNQKKTKEPIKNEWQNGLKNVKYSLAMARLGSPQPNPKSVDSATAQFFINVKDNGFLNNVQSDGGAYAVFGKVVSGMDVVDKIKAAKTTTKGGMTDVPVETVTITSAARMSAEDAQKAIGK